jgi:hypothetical protein
LVLAIECDGASYHSSPTARDRDRLRQQMLEGLGWRFHRIWSTDWFLRRDGEIERAVEAYRRAVAHAEALDAGQITASPEFRRKGVFPSRHLRGTAPWSPPRPTSFPDSRVPRTRMLETDRARNFGHGYPAGQSPVTFRRNTGQESLAEKNESEVVLLARDPGAAGVYVPVTGNRPGRKRRMWEAVRYATAMRKDEPFLIVGDLNAGDFPADKSWPGRPFKFTDEYRRMVGAGFVEACRHHHPGERDYSWYRHDGSGFRIDMPSFSPLLLPRVVRCRYSHEERLAGASDHSMLIIDLEPALE